MMQRIDMLVAKLKDYRSKEMLDRSRRPTEDEWNKLRDDLDMEVRQKRHEVDR